MTEIESRRAVIVLAIKSLSNALWLEVNISDEELKVAALQQGAESATEILRTEVHS